jgi:hypothetical protein
MKTRLALVSLLVFFLGSLVWLSIPSTKASAQSSSANPEAICVERCNDNYLVCHDRAVDALVACLGTTTVRDVCTDRYLAAQAACKRAHDACIDGC